MQTMSVAANRPAWKKEGSFFNQVFNQVALFSVMGVAMSMAFIIVGGFQIVDPWF